jgi:predicted amidophosphoribosyltransferase
VVYCANCGRQVDDDANFCPKCGVKTEKGVKEGVASPWFSDPRWRQDVDSALQKAGRSIDDGLKVAKDSLRDAAKRVEEEVQTARKDFRERAGPVFCKSCGQENTRYARFCTKCGKELK